MVIDFVAKNMVLSCSNREIIIAGSRNYLTAHFTFETSNWDGMTKIASFFDEQGREYAKALENGICQVPNEVTKGKRFYVKLTAIKDSTRFTTNRVGIRQKVN